MTDAAVDSVVPPEAIIDHDELTDLRAYQRTFDGAYTRTALGQLSYAILILKLFEKDFYWCGLIYTALAVQLIMVSVYRYNLATSNVDRWKSVNLLNREEDVAGTTGSNAAAAQQGGDAGSSSVQHTGHQSMFRRTFRTAGGVVAYATAGALVLEIALAVLVIRM